mgnify:CR=1 FL=1
MRKHIKTVNKAMLNKTLRTGGCGAGPASLQNFLHRWQPGLRTLQIISELNAAPCLVQGAVLLSMQKRKVGIHADT